MCKSTKQKGIFFGHSIFKKMRERNCKYNITNEIIMKRSDKQVLVTIYPLFKYQREFKIAFSA